MDRFRAGDREAFTALYRAHHPAIFRFAFHMTADPVKAAEITQDVFVWLIHHAADSIRNAARCPRFSAAWRASSCNAGIAASAAGCHLTPARSSGLRLAIPRSISLSPSTPSRFARPSRCCPSVTAKPSCCAISKAKVTMRPPRRWAAPWEPSARACTAAANCWRANFSRRKRTDHELQRSPRDSYRTACAAGAAVLDPHFEACAECARFLQAQLALDSAFAALPREVPAPADLERDVTRRIRRSRRIASRHATVAALWWLPAAALAASSGHCRSRLHRAGPAPPIAGEPFVEIPYIAPLAPYERTRIVRMDVPVSALIAAGFEVHAADTGAALTSRRALWAGWPRSRHSPGIEFRSQFQLGE